MATPGPPSIAATHLGGKRGARARKVDMGVTSGCGYGSGFRAGWGLVSGTAAGNGGSGQGQVPVYPCLGPLVGWGGQGRGRVRDIQNHTLR